MDDSAVKPGNADTREACDRCHKLKSRCTKPRLSSVCHRCQKLGLSCAYSPPLRAGRPRGTAYRRREPRLSRGVNPKLHNYDHETVKDHQQPSPFSFGIDEELSSLPTVEGTPIHRLEDRESLLEHRPQSQPTPISMDTHTIELEAQSKSAERPDRYNGTRQTDNDTSFSCQSSISNRSAPLGWYSDLTSLLSMPDWQALNSEYHGESQDLTARDGQMRSSMSMSDWPLPDREHHTGAQHRTAEHTDLLSPTSTLQSCNNIEKLMNLQRDVYHLCETTSSGSSEQSDDHEFYVGWEACGGNIEKTFSASETLIKIIYDMTKSGHAASNGGSSVCACSPSAEGDIQAHIIGNKFGQVDSSIVLLILSCHLRLLDIYASLARFLRHSNRTGGSTGTGHMCAIPVVAIGACSLAMSPDANLNLILQITLDIIQRLVTAVNHCTATAASYMERGSGASFEEPSASEYTRRYSLGEAEYRIAQEESLSVKSANARFLQAMLVDVQRREAKLVGNLCTLK